MLYRIRPLLWVENRGQRDHFRCKTPFGEYHINPYGHLMFIVNFRTVFESKSSNRDKAKLAAEDHHRQQLEQWLEPITE